LFWLLILVSVTLFPFEFRAASPVMERIAAGLWPNEVTTSAEVVSNVLLFVPLGVLLHGRGRRGPAGWRLVAIACAAGLLMSVAIECLQVFLPRREPTIVDIIANTAGAFCGAMAHRVWGARVQAELSRWGADASDTLLAVLLTAFTISVLSHAGALQRQTRLSNWSPDFPLQVGNERTGSRPWRGRLFAFELTDAAASPESVRQFAAGDSLMLPGAPVARFEFSGRPPYRDAAGHLPNLEWTEDPGSVETAGVQLPGEPWLQTDGPVPAIAQRLGRSSAFSLRIQCATDDVNQVGPARIVSNSVDFGRRNLTIGQQDEDLIVRIRSPHTGGSGARPEIVVPDVFSVLGPRDILITYDGATVLAAVAASNRVHRIPLSPGPILIRWLTSLEIETDEHQMLERMYLGILFIVPGVLIGVLKEAIRDRLVIGGIWVLLFAVLLEGTLAVVSGRAFSWPGVTLSVSVGLAVMLPFAVARSEPRVRERG
jgi:hypothetical protein